MFIINVQPMHLYATIACRTVFFSSYRVIQKIILKIKAIAEKSTKHKIKQQTDCRSVFYSPSLFQDTAELKYPCLSAHLYSKAELLNQQSRTLHSKLLKNKDLECKYTPVYLLQAQIHHQQNMQFFLGRSQGFQTTAHLVF